MAPGLNKKPTYLIPATQRRQELGFPSDRAGGLGAGAPVSPNICQCIIVTPQADQNAKED
jgi:hypothetical protein